MAITGSRISKSKSATTIANSSNHSYKLWSTESTAVGALLYVNNQFPYKLSNKLTALKVWDLKLSFIDACYQKNIVFVLVILVNVQITSFQKTNKTAFLLENTNADLLSNELPPLKN